MMLIGDLDASPLAQPSVAASSAPSASATPDSVPPPTPTSAATPATRPLRAGDWAATDLTTVPLHPAIGADAFTSIQPGSDVYIVEAREGWYHVEALDSSTFDYIFGWVPAAPAEALEKRPAQRCQPAEDGILPTLGLMHPQRTVECYGAAKEIRIHGFVIEGSDIGQLAYGGEPSWLAERSTLSMVGAVGPAVTTWQIAIHIPPDRDLTIPMSERDGFEGVLLAVTGHYADARAGTCELVPIADGYPELDDDLEERSCAQRFVVDAVEVIDPG
jgi:hypothetical protein